MACAGTPAVLAAVRAGTVDAGCVPIENSVEGAVAAVLDELVLDPPLVIVREALLPVRSPSWSAPAPLRRGPHRRFAPAWPGADPGMDRGQPAGADVLSTSTAERPRRSPGARWTPRSPHRSPPCHGLAALADDVADTPDAVTRFGLVAGPPTRPPSGNDRTTLAATTQNRPGTLLGLLTELAVRGIDLTRIESRPIKDKRGEYWFTSTAPGTLRSRPWARRWPRCTAAAGCAPRFLPQGDGGTPVPGAAAPARGAGHASARSGSRPPPSGWPGSGPGAST